MDNRTNRNDYVKSSYHLKDKKCTLLQPVTQTDEYGNHKATYTDAGSYWCYACERSGGTTFTASKFKEEEDYLFVLNYNDFVAPFWRILYRGNTYEITRVTSQHDYHEELYCYAKRV